MKTLILFNSKNGATEKCAKYIADKCSDTDLHSVKSFKGKLNDYEQIIIGTPVYMGRYDKKIKEILNENKDILLNVDLSIFVCCMNRDETEEVVSGNLPKDIIEHADIYHVGGAYYFDRLNWFQRLVVKKIAKISESKEDFDYEVLNNICKKNT